MARRWWGPKVQDAWAWWKRRPYWLTWIWWRGWWTSPGAQDLEDNPKLQEVDAWASGYTPVRDQESEVYSLTREYAETRYAEMVKLSEIFDKKFEDVMRTAGAILAVLAAAARVAGTLELVLRSPLALGAIAFLVLAVVLSAKSREPALTVTPMDVSLLLKIADLDARPSRSDMEGALTASYHYAIEGTIVANDWKAKQLKRTTALFCLGLLLLLVTLIGPIRNSASSRYDPTPTDPVRGTPGRAPTRD